MTQPSQSPCSANHIPPTFIWWLVFQLVLCAFVTLSRESQIREQRVIQCPTRLPLVVNLVMVFTVPLLEIVALDPYVMSTCGVPR